jgi:hypothetical protein
METKSEKPVIEQLFEMIRDLSSDMKELNSRISDIEVKQSTRKATPPKATISEDQDAFEQFNKSEWKPDRRTTMFDGYLSRPVPSVNPKASIAANAGASSPKERRLPQIVRSMPSYDGISISVLSLNRAISFTDSVIEYQTQHQIDLSVPSIVTGDARDMVMSYYGITDFGRYMRLPCEDVLFAIQELVRPNTPTAFVQALSTNIPLKCPADYKPDGTNFRILFRSFLNYRTTWLKRFDYMKQNNESNVPPCHDREGGLIYLFMRGLKQFKYAENVYSNFTRAEIQEFYKKDGFDKFLIAFYARLEKDNEDSKISRNLHTLINYSSSENYEPVKKSFANDREKQPSRPNNFVKNKTFNRINALTIETPDETSKDDEFDPRPTLDELEDLTEHKEITKCHAHEKQDRAGNDQRHDQFFFMRIQSWGNKRPYLVKHHGQSDQKR